MNGNAPATLHMLCGKIAAGKSTLAERLAAGKQSVLLSEDHFLARLYPGEIANIADYRRCSMRLRSAIGPHIIDLLQNGITVVLDFQANTPDARGWMRSLFETANSQHQLHYLEASDATCRARLEVRNSSGTHQYQVSDADFDLFTSYFVPPEAGEGFVIVTHRQS